MKTIYRTPWLIWFYHMSIFDAFLYKISNSRIVLMLIKIYKYLVSRVFHISPSSMTTMIHAYSWIF